MRTYFSSIPFLMIILFSFSTDARAGQDGWKAGTARAVITPAEPMWMSGYASRNHAATGKIHDLWVKALALEDPKRHHALLITADLVGVPKSLSDEVCLRLRRKLKLGRSAIMIATSHTHSGPLIYGHLDSMFDLPPGEHEKIVRYTRRLIEQMVSAGEEAFRKLEPAELAWTNGTAGFAVNRRNNVEKDVPQLIEEGRLKGPVDHDVPVMRVATPSGTVKAIVFGYACHNTVLADYDWCGDYAGFAQIELERMHAGATALFFEGCGGDQNPLPRRKVELAESYGRELAYAVNSALTAPMRRIQGSFIPNYKLIDLPYDRLPTADEIEANLTGKDVYEQRRARLLRAHIEREGELRSTYPYPIQIWKLGSELTWVALGGEAVVDYSLRLKSELGKDTWVAAYCNDVMAYIPSKRVWEEGGYEGGDSMKYYGLPSRWAASVEEQIVAAAHKAVKRVRGR